MKILNRIISCFKLSEKKPKYYVVKYKHGNTWKFALTCSVTKKIRQIPGSEVWGPFSSLAKAEVSKSHRMMEHLLEI